MHALCVPLNCTESGRKSGHLVPCDGSQTITLASSAVLTTIVTNSLQLEMGVMFRGNSVAHRLASEGANLNDGVVKLWPDFIISLVTD
jgi:hypothetical protein